MSNWLASKPSVRLHSLELRGPAADINDIKCKWRGLNHRKHILPIFPPDRSHPLFDPPVSEFAANVSLIFQHLDLALLILCYFSLRELVAMRLVCKRWRQVISHVPTSWESTDPEEWKVLRKFFPNTIQYKCTHPGMTSSSKFSELPKLPHLQSLALEKAALWANLTSYPRLTSLSVELYSNWSPPPIFDCVRLRALSTLRSLTVVGDCRNAAALLDLPNLRRLHLSSSNALAQSGCLTGLTQLESLRIDISMIQRVRVVFPHLRTLLVDKDTPLERYAYPNQGQGIKHIMHVLPSLHCLHFLQPVNSDPAGAFACQLGSLTQLTELSLQYHSHDFPYFLSCMPQLRILSLRAPADLRSTHQPGCMLPVLDSLEYHGGAVHSLPFFKAHATRLSQLTIDPTDFFLRWAEYPFPNLTSLVLLSKHLGLLRCTSLRVLDLQHPENILNVSLFTSLTHLRHLSRLLVPAISEPLKIRQITRVTLPNLSIIARAYPNTFEDSSSSTESSDALAESSDSESDIDENSQNSDRSGT